jgi:LysM repeat protein
MIAEQQKQIEALTAGLQKVSTQVQVSKPARQTVLNNQLSDWIAALSYSTLTLYRL